MLLGIEIGVEDEPLLTLVDNVEPPNNVAPLLAFKTYKAFIVTGLEPEFNT
ncbi:hypothetical protein [Caldisphaera sp.]|uniref:hypothetical protein n=1 Tax=Caldisphaera sp. TaxID=2060322 RepID=UPI003D0EF2D9